MDKLHGSVTLQMHSSEPGQDFGIKADVSAARDVKLQILTSPRIS